MYSYRIALSDGTQSLILDFLFSRFQISDVAELHILLEFQICNSGFCILKPGILWSLWISMSLSESSHAFSILSRNAPLKESVGWHLRKRPQRRLFNVQTLKLILFANDFIMSMYDSWGCLKQTMRQCRQHILKEKNFNWYAVVPWSSKLLERCSSTHLHLLNPTGKRRLVGYVQRVEELISGPAKMKSRWKW